MRPNTNRWFLWSAVRRSYGLGWRMVVLAVSAVLVIGSISNCSKSTKPKDVKYNIYLGVTDAVGDSFDNRIYIYDADSLNLIDSILETGIPGELTASPDGRWLYIRNSSTLLKLDLHTKQVAWSNPDIWGVKCIANGTLLLAGRDVLRPEDASLVRHLSDSLSVQWGSSRGTKMAAIGRTQNVGGEVQPYLTVIDVLTGDVSGEYEPRLASGVALQGIYTACVHPDGKRVLAIGVYGSVQNSWIVVGDVETGKTLFEQRIYRPLGEIAISDDGAWAAVTDQGTGAFGEHGKVHLIDLRALAFHSPSPPIPGAQVRFLPGEYRVVTTPAAGIWDTGPMNMIDGPTAQLEREVWLPSHRSPNGGLAVGPRQ